MIVVVDSNAVIGLAKGKAFGLLHDLFGTTYIPLVLTGAIHPLWQLWLQLLPLVRPLSRRLRPRRMPVAISTDPIIQRLRKAADREVISLAQACGARWLITEDQEVRAVANSLSVDLLNTGDILILAKRAGLIPDCRSVLDLMIASQFGIPDTVYQRILRLAGE